MKQIIILLLNQTTVIYPAVNRYRVALAIVQRGTTLALALNEKKETPEQRTLYRLTAERGIQRRRVVAGISRIEFPVR